MRIFRIAVKSKLEDARTWQLELVPECGYVGSD
jgi:hypothetical protein